MPDQPLIDRTAATIAKRLCQYAPEQFAKNVLLIDGANLSRCKRSRVEMERIIAVHLQRMLAERDEKGLFDET